MPKWCFNYESRKYKYIGRDFEPLKQKDGNAP